MWRTAYKLTKTLVDVPAPRRLAENLKMKIEKFKQHIPILSISCNPGMKDRHWQQVLITSHSQATQPTPGSGSPLEGRVYFRVKLLLFERRICWRPRDSNESYILLKEEDGWEMEWTPLFVNGWPFSLGFHCWRLSICWSSQWPHRFSLSPFLSKWLIEVLKDYRSVKLQWEGLDSFSLT